MFKWVQSGLSVVAGTAEPEYGPEAIHPITKRCLQPDSEDEEPTQVYRATVDSDFNWQSPNYTNVETQTFYFTDLTAKVSGFAQIIHSNVMGVHTTAQFTFRLYKDSQENIWTSTQLENFRIEGNNFYADGVSLEIQDGDTYVLKSTVNQETQVDFTVKRVTDGVIFGDDGMSFYGEDPEQPWGSMRHLFWPRCRVNGTVKTPTKEYTFEDGLSMFVMALQGMKPHHAAKSWNFINFHSDNYSAITMEFTTPKSYANTRVNIGIVANDEKVLYATINNQVVHLDPQVDEIGWPVPKGIEFKYVKDDQDVASVKGQLKNLVERVDVMAEIPQLVKNIVSSVAGAKPYIYQYSNDFELEVNGEKESGIGFCEVTFICQE